MDDVNCHSYGKYPSREYSDQTCFCFKNTKNHNLKLNLLNSYFIFVIHMSLVRAKSGHS